MGEHESGPLAGWRMSRRDALRRAGITGIAAIGAPAVGALLQACGGASGGGGASDTVVYSISTEPKVLNPPVHTLLIESTVMSLIFPGLVKQAKGGGFAPHLAEDYQVQPDGLKYTFKLRKGLKWEDGQPLTSKDFKFTWQAYVNPKTATAYINGWDQVADIETPDDTTIVVHAKAPYSAFLLNVGGSAILPQHILQNDFDNLPKSSFNRKPVGCGPYKFKSWQTASQITLEANPNYFKGKPKIGQFIFKIDPNENTQINELQTGSIDLVQVSPPNWSKVKSLQGVGTSAYDSFTYQLVQLDQWPGQFLSDVKVRQALAWATPKQSYVKDILKGLAVVADSDVPPVSPYYNPNVQKYTYDLNKAKSLLQEAGFTIQNGAATKDGRQLAVPISVLKTNPGMVQFAQVLKESWTQLGVKTDVTPMDSSSLYGNDGPQFNHKDEALIYSWGQGPDPDDYINWDSSQIPADADAAGDNNGRYSNPQMDELVRKGRITVDTGRRKQIYNQVQELLARDVPVIFLCFAKSLTGYSTKLQSFQPDAFQGQFWNVEQWTKSS